MASKDEKTNMTVLVTCNAAGLQAPPLIIYPRKSIPQQIWRDAGVRFGVKEQKAANYAPKYKCALGHSVKGSIT